MPPPLNPYACTGGPSSVNMPVPSQTLPTPGQHLYHPSQRDFRPNRQKQGTPLPILEYHHLASQYRDAARFVRLRSVRTPVERDVRIPKWTDEES